MKINICVGKHVYPDTAIDPEQINSRLNTAGYPFDRCKQGLDKTIELLDGTPSGSYYKVIGDNVLDLKPWALEETTVEFMQPRCTVAPSAFAQLSHNPKYSTALAARFNCVVATQAIGNQQILWYETLKIIKHSKSHDKNWDTLDKAYKAMGYPEWFLDTTDQGDEIGVNLMPQSAAMGIFNLNSNPTPNVHIKLVSTNEKTARLQVFATKAIEAGEELCWQYNYNDENPTVEPTYLHEANNIVSGFSKAFEYKIGFPAVTALQQRALYKWCASPSACERFDTSIVAQTLTIKQPDSSPVHWCCNYNFVCRPDDLTLAMLRWSGCTTSLGKETLASFCDTDDTSYVITHNFATAPELQGVLVEYATPRPHVLIDAPFRCYDIKTKQVTMKNIHELPGLLLGGSKTCLVDGNKIDVASLAKTVVDSQKRVLVTASCPTQNVHIQISHDIVVSAIVAMPRDPYKPPNAHILTAFPVDFWAWLSAQGSCKIVGGDRLLPQLQWDTGATLRWNKTGWNCSVQDADKLFEWQLGVLYDGKKFKTALQNGTVNINLLKDETQKLQLNRRYVKQPDVEPDKQAGQQPGQQPDEDTVVLPDSGDDVEITFHSGEADNCLVYLATCNEMFKGSTFLYEGFAELSCATIYYFADVGGRGPYVYMKDNPTDALGLIVEFTTKERFKLVPAKGKTFVGAERVFGVPWPPAQVDAVSLSAAQTKFVAVHYTTEMGHHLIASNVIPEGQIVTYYYGRMFLDQDDATLAEERKPWFTAAEGGMTVDSHFFRLGLTDISGLVAGIRGFEYKWLEETFPLEKLGLMSLSNSAVNGTNAAAAPFEKEHFKPSELRQLYNGAKPTLKTKEVVPKGKPILWNYTKSMKHNEVVRKKRGGAPSSGQAAKQRKTNEGPPASLWSIKTITVNSRGLIKYSDGNESFKAEWKESATQNMRIFILNHLNTNANKKFFLFDPAHNGDCGSILMAAAFKVKVDVVKRTYGEIIEGYRIGSREFVDYQMLAFYCAFKGKNIFMHDLDADLTHYFASDTPDDPKTLVVLIFNSQNTKQTHFAAFRLNDIGDDNDLFMDTEELAAFFAIFKSKHLKTEPAVVTQKEIGLFTASVQDELQAPRPKRRRKKGDGLGMPFTDFHVNL